MCFERFRVAAVAVVLHPDDALIGKRRGVAAIACRHDTVKQIDAAANAFEQIDRPAHAHQVPRLVRGQHGGRRGDHAVHLRRRFADAQPSDRVTGKLHRGEFSRAPLTQFRIETSLDDGEECLVSVRLCELAAACPADRPEHRISNGGLFGRQGDDMVEHHHDIAAERFLNGNRTFRREFDLAAIQVRAKRRPLFGNLAHFGQAKELKPAAIGQDGPVPTTKAMQPSEFADHFLARPQRKVVSVAQNHLGARGPELVECHPLDGSLGSDGHESRGLNGSMRGVKCSAPRGARRIRRVQFKAEMCCSIRG